ncbi:transposase [Streptomyces bobili]
MVTKTQHNLQAARLPGEIQLWLAGSGYASAASFEALAGLPLLVSVTSAADQAGFPAKRQQAPASQQDMAARLATPAGRAQSRQRIALVELGFAQIFQPSERHLNYRGRRAVDAEIKLLGTVHNLNKLINQRLKSTFDLHRAEAVRQPLSFFTEGKQLHEGGTPGSPVRRASSAQRTRRQRSPGCWVWPSPPPVATPIASKPMSATMGASHSRLPRCPVALVVRPAGRSVLVLVHGVEHPCRVRHDRRHETGHAVTAQLAQPIGGPGQHEGPPARYEIRVFEHVLIPTGVSAFPRAPAPGRSWSCGRKPATALARRGRFVGDA